MISDRQPLRFSDRSLSFCIDWNFIQIMNRGLNEESRGGGSKKLILLIKMQGSLLKTVQCGAIKIEFKTDKQNKIEKN